MKSIKDESCLYMIQTFSFLTYLKGRNKNRERKLTLSVFKRGNQQRVHFWETAHLDKLKLMQTRRLVRPNGQGSQYNMDSFTGRATEHHALSHQVIRMRFSMAYCSHASPWPPSLCHQIDSIPKSWPLDLLPVCVLRVVFISIFGWMSRLITASLYGQAYLDFSEIPIFSRVAIPFHSLIFSTWMTLILHSLTSIWRLSLLKKLIDRLKMKRHPDIWLQLFHFPHG